MRIWNAVSTYRDYLHGYPILLALCGTDFTLTELSSRRRLCRYQLHSFFKVVVMTFAAVSIATSRNAKRAFARCVLTSLRQCLYTISIRKALKLSLENLMDVICITTWLHHHKSTLERLINNWCHKNYKPLIFIGRFAFCDQWNCRNNWILQKTCVIGQFS